MRSIPELNAIKKDWRKVDLKIALCYPNVYRAGMSGLTMRLLYALFNKREDVLCERFFVPTLKEPFRSLESNRLLKEFDVVAFTLQFEEDYPNVIWMLLESRIPPRREERKAHDPLVIAGGPCATGNPEPLADYIDLFIVGEAEPILDPLIDKLRAFKSLSSRIDEFTDVKGVYVSQFSNQTERVWVRNLDDAPHPLAQQIPLVNQRSPYMTVFGKAFAVEATRGCGRCCRFCLIGHISLPKRERSPTKIEEIISEGLRYTPVKKVSLIGTSIFDYSHLEDACEFIVSSGFELAVPSIRPESITERLAGLLAKGKQRTVSLAPDGASPRMRKIANKRMEDEDIIKAAKTLVCHGVNRLKLYFVIGLPEETPGDIEAIADLTKKIAEVGYKPKSIHLNINPLIPKPHTPFQWEKTPSVPYVRESLNLLKRRLKGDKRVVISCLDPRRAQIQALLSLGDRKAGKAIEYVAHYGGGLGSWRRAFKECGVSLESYTSGKRVDASMPWDKISIGLGRQHLLGEVQRYKQDAQST